MKPGRKPQGPRTASKLDASGEARKRLELILSTLSGEKTVAEAAADLGIGERRFFQMRDEALGAAATRLEPGRSGRPPLIRQEDPKVAELEAEVRELRIELRAAQVREEISVVMPHLLKPRPPAQKKTATRGSRRSDDSTRRTSEESDGRATSSPSETGEIEEKRRSGSDERSSGK